MFDTALYLSMRKKLIAVSFVLLFCSLAHAAGLFQKFEKSAFYEAMASGDLKQVNAMLSVLENAGSEYNGYEGALLMRKAGLVTIPKTKLKYFKNGRIKFQQAYNADSTNTELHFLRLTIQEHAPNIVKYKSDISADKAYIIAHFKSQSPVVQHAIKEYSKTSKVLRPEDL